jgi:hypothetical protein
MAEKDDLNDKDFVPPASFLQHFENTPVGEEEDFEEEEEEHEEEEISEEDRKKKEGEEEKKGEEDEETPEAKKKKEDADAAKAEEDKISKMSPEEKEAYLKEKNTPAASVKPFEEELLSRFNGKYKSVQEIESALNTTPEPQFADDTVKFFNEFVKNGGKIDNEFLSAITTDYDAMTDGVELMMRHLKANDPRCKNWDNEDLEYEVRQLYKMDEWSDDEAEETNETRRIMAKRLERDAKDAREGLKQKQESLKYIKPVDPLVAEKEAEDRQIAQKKWETEIVPKVIEAVSKLSTPVSEKEAFDYDIDAADKGEVAGLLKSMGNNAKAFWGQFYDKDGKFDHVKVARMLLRDRSYEKAVKLAREQGKAIGGEQEHRNIGNIDFKKDQKRGGSSKEKSFNEAAYDSVSKNL